MKLSRTLWPIQFFQRVLLIFTFFCAFSLLAKEPISEATVETAKTYAPYPHVEIVTNLGNIYLELDGIRAPISTINFLQYVESGHYDGTIFHRVIPGFMAQGGGYDTDFNERETRSPIYNESGNGLSNLTGTIAMARTNDPHSGTSQFYINVVDNQKLDPQPSRWGYTVFGQVLYGMPLVQDIVMKKTAAGGTFSKDVPVEPVIIERMRIMSTDEQIPVQEFNADDFIETEEIDNAVTSAKEQAEKAKSKLLKENL